MKPIRHIQQWDQRSCVAACLLMMTDLEATHELREGIDGLYKRSGSIHACCSLMSIPARTVNWPAGQWVEEGGIFLVYAVKDTEFHALIVDCRGNEPVVYDPARGWGDGEFVWSDPEPCSGQRVLKNSMYLPALRFTDKNWYNH